MTNLAPTTRQATSLPLPLEHILILQQHERDLHTLDRHQRSLHSALRTVSKQNQHTEIALEKHVRRLEWMLCAAFAMLCLLMVTVGLMWRAMP